MTVANSISLRGRSILITGGSRGLGSEMAQALVEAGADVMISGRRHSSALSNTYNKLKKSQRAWKENRRFISVSPI